MDELKHGARHARACGTEVPAKTPSGHRA